MLFRNLAYTSKLMQDGDGEVGFLYTWFNKVCISALESTDTMTKTRSAILNKWYVCRKERKIWVLCAHEERQNMSRFYCTRIGTTKPSRPVNVKTGFGVHG